MGSFRFRRSIKIAPGLKINLNKKSVSLTAGRRGAHVTRSFGGRSSYSVGAPGTGLWYRGYGGRPREGGGSGGDETLARELATAPEGTMKAKIGNFFFWIGGFAWIALAVLIGTLLISRGLHNFGLVYAAAALLWTAFCLFLSYRRHRRLRAPFNRARARWNATHPRLDRPRSPPRIESNETDSREV
jgi:hypothetical protein